MTESTNGEVNPKQRIIFCQEDGTFLFSVYV